jgi:hypothetical protein
MSEDRFLESLRRDARRLRYESDDESWMRLAARIRQRIAQPTVMEILAAWFRPVAASVAALGIAAAIGLTFIESADSTAMTEQVEISMAGDVYSVGE